MWTPLDPSQSWEKRFRFILGSISFLTIGALAAFLGATAQLRKDFSQAVDSIPALDPDLIAKYDKAFDSLVSCAISNYGSLAVKGNSVLNLEPSPLLFDLGYSMLLAL